MNHTAPDSIVCYNCGADLHGAYCAQCGQKALPLNPRLHDFLHDLTHEVLHVDGKIFRSIRKLLLSPGFLTREQIEGRRARWVPPIRLYLIFSVTYFALTSLLPAGGLHVELKNSKTQDQETVSELRSLGFESERDLQEAMASQPARRSCARGLSSLCISSRSSRPWPRLSCRSFSGGGKPGCLR